MRNPVSNTHRHHARPGLPLALVLIALWGAVALIPRAAIAQNSSGPSSPPANGSKQIVETPISAAPTYAKRGLVIGIDHYEHVAQLTDCANDANHFAALLKSKFGFTDVTVMTDELSTSDDLQPTYSNLRYQLRHLIEGIVSDQTEIVIFYSGHGVRWQSNDSGDADYLVPLDGDPDDIGGTCINYSSFKSEIDTKQPSRALLFIDACRNLTTGKGVGGSGFGAAGEKLGPQMAELLSCQPAQTSNEGQPGDFRESVFTHYLIQGLEGDPNAVDTQSRAVTFDSLKQFVQGQVSEYVRAHFDGAVQVPSGSASMGNMVLAKVAPGGGKLALTPAQQKAANEKLTSLWTDATGANARTKTQSMTASAVQQALDAGADVNARDTDGETTLIAASALDGLDIVQVLIAAGADVNAVDGTGDTALMGAAMTGNAPVAQALLAAGAKANAQDKNGMSPLLMAVTTEYPEIVDALLNAGANPNLTDNRGATPLMVAAGSGHSDAVKSLLAHGAGVNITTQGNTALIFAAQNGYSEVVQALIAGGAKVDLKDQNGHTALWDAENPAPGVSDSDKAATVAALKAAGAKE